MMRGIIGGRLYVERLEGTFKLSQNKGEADRLGAAKGLGEASVMAKMIARHRSIPNPLFPAKAGTQIEPRAPDDPALPS
jgi:hypothetical protein